MRVALDTNVLAYAAGVNGPVYSHAALEILRKLPQEETFISIQALGELFRVLAGKAGLSAELCRKTILRYRDTYPLVETSSAVLLAATDLALDHQIGIWDAIIFAAAVEAQCRLLLSEDMHDGFAWRGVTVVNPFAAKKNEMLKGLL